jgi:hypothetical protein
LDKIAEVLLHFSDKVSGVKEIKKSGEAGILANAPSANLTLEKITCHICSATKRLQKTGVSFPRLKDIVNLIEKCQKADADATHIELVTNTFSESRVSGRKILTVLQKSMINIIEFCRFF